MDSAPEDLSSNAVFWTVPQMPGFPEEAQGKPMLVVAALFPGAPEEGERLTMPLRRLGTPLLDLSGSVPYTAAQVAFDPFFPYGTQQYYFKATYLNHLGDDVIATIAESAMRRPSPMSLITIWHFGGAMSRVAPTATAFWGRRVPYMVSFDAVWSDPVDADRNVDWARSSWAATRSYSDGGLYVNFSGFGEEGEALVRATYGDNYERLVAVKNRYDPTNLFSVNQNIKPA
jgi:FAD/FMN-containing dehydrogenase